MFDDFGGEILGDSASGSTPPLLQERISDFKAALVKKDAQLAKNWRQGNWKVRGFSLDNCSTDDATAIHVSKVAPGLDEHSIVVGRSDGSVVLVTLGTEYWTNFRAAPVKQGDPTSDLLLQQPEQEDTSQEPFEITHQFMAGANAISAIMVADHADKDDTVLVTASNDGVIHLWAYPDTSNDKVVPLRTLEFHRGSVVALKKVKMADNKELLFSASRDGTMALWDLWTGDLVFHCSMWKEEENNGSNSITCADVEGSHIYVGLSSGYIVGYLVDEMVQAASVGDAFPKPNGKFKAHDAGVTALSCAGEGSLRISRPDTKSSILLTGGTDGIVKQWEMISDDSSPTSTKLQHWPRISSQRMKRRAHLFEGHSPGPITSLACADPSKILSAGADGTVRAWSPSKGTEMFRMDGFTDSLTSLCLVEDLLITDGMEQFVCVHDFDVNDSEFESGYELEW